MPALFICALALCAIPARADVTLTGEARLGLFKGFAATTPALNHKVKIKATLAGETDAGLIFGATAGLDVADRADKGLAGVVFLQTPSLKLSMGDVQGAAAAALGQVVTIGLTELGDPNNITYIANGGVLFSSLGSLVPADTADPSALVTWTSGPLRLHASLTNPSGATTAWALGVDRQSGDLRLGIAVEGQSAARQVIAGATLTRGDVTLKAVAGVIRSAGQTYAQGAVGAVWTHGDLTLQAFATDDSRLGLGTSARALGIGAEFDLGGQARLKGGIAWDLTHDRQAFDIGVALGF